MKEFVLNQNQKKIIKKIDFLEVNFYLAGGTALALQLGHRTSKDFDFYSKREFDSKKLYFQFKRIFAKDISKPITLGKDTLRFEIGSTELSFFRYPYFLIKPLKRWQSLLLANPEDIAAMKVEAIISRGIKRDFVDIYYLIKKFGLKSILKFTQEKYPDTFNQHLCLRALIYFIDAEAKDKEQGRARIYLYDSKANWQRIKKYLVEEVKKYQKALIRRK